MPKAVAQSDAKKLIRRPRPKFDESLRGFALRIDSENTVNLFRSRMKSFKEACLTLPDMEKATGRFLSVLRSRVCLMPANETRSSHVNVFGNVVPRTWVTAGVKRVCPQCIHQRGYMQATWEVHVIQSCLEHECLLLNQCQSCNCLLSWEYGGLFHCRCGANLRSMRTEPVGRMRADLDLLISESLNPTLKGKANIWQSGTLNMSSGSISSRFPEFAVIAGHIAPRIGYSIEYTDADARDEQQAECALRLIEMGRSGIEAVLFGLLGNELHSARLNRSANLLRRGPERRREQLHACFNLNIDLQQMSFVRNVLWPAWDQVHERRLASVMEAIAELAAQTTKTAEIVRANLIRMRQQKLAQRRADREREIDRQRRAKDDAKRLKQVERAAARFFDEKRLFAFVLAAYRNDARLAEMRFRESWEWFIDRRAKWGP